MTIPIAEKLRKPDCWIAVFHGGGRFDEIEESAPFFAADVIDDLYEAAEEALQLLRSCREKGKGPTNAEALLMLALRQAKVSRVLS